MARRRKPSRKTKKSYRRKSIGAVGTGMLMDIAALAAGAIAAKQIGKLLPASISPKIASAGKVALGVMIPNFIKNPMMKSFGNGMIAVGATELVGSFIPALGATDDVVLLSGVDDIGGIDQIGGDDINAVNGMDISAVNGDDDYSSY